MSETNPTKAKNRYVPIFENGSQGAPCDTMAEAVAKLREASEDGIVRGYVRGDTVELPPVQRCRGCGCKTHRTTGLCNVCRLSFRNAFGVAGKASRWPHWPHGQN